MGSDLGFSGIPLAVMLRMDCRVFGGRSREMGELLLQRIQAREGGEWTRVGGGGH